MPGIFKVEKLTEESKMGRGQGIITRIRFTPRTLAREMILAFKVL
jgi:hypothetical protein